MSCHILIQRTNTLPFSGATARMSGSRVRAPTGDTAFGKDSYANALVPFLAIHFDLEIIDLRSYTGSAGALAKDTGAVAVLILYGADMIASSDDLTLLGYGLSALKNQ